MITRNLITLFRHAHSSKNVEFRHGGPGADLVKESEDRIIDTISMLLKYSPNYKHIFCSPRPQCEQTAQIISHYIIVDWNYDTLLEPIQLGIIDGLSDQEVESNYPGISKRMKLWRSGQLEVQELNVSDMENPSDFCKRGQVFIDKVLSLDSSVLIIGTRSILTLLASVLLERKPQKGGDYKSIEWPNCGFMTFRFSSDGKLYSSKMSSVKLKVSTDE